MAEHNWPIVAAECRQLLRKNILHFCSLLGSTPLCPIGEEFLAQLVSIPLKSNSPEKLQRLLFEKYQIEIPVMQQDGQVYLRYSINAFNSQDDLDILYKALEEIIKDTDLINLP
jgi:isopenicillin-N epimerase